MHAGEKIICPLCGEKTLLKSRKVFDGFTPKGAELICMLCGGKVADDLPEQSSHRPTPERGARLAALLGEEIPEKIKLTADETAGRFCRHCTYFIEHPFKTVCGRTLKPTDPMAECPFFEKQEHEQ